MNPKGQNVSMIFFFGLTFKLMLRRSSSYHSKINIYIYILHYYIILYMRLIHATLRGKPISHENT